MDKVNEIDFFKFYPLNPSLAEEMDRLFAKKSQNSNFRFHTSISTPEFDLMHVAQDLLVNDQSFNLDVEDILAEFKQNGVDQEYCPDFINSSLNINKNKNKKVTVFECVFCRNNGEEQTFYKKHILKDKHGRISCPVLRAYTCPNCGAYGDMAHTIKYCPKSAHLENPSAVLAMKTARTASGKKKNFISK